MKTTKEVHDGYEIVFDVAEYSRHAAIKPPGFWATNMATIRQDTDYEGAWGEAIVNWSCGGTDGTLSNGQAVENFITALVIVQDIARQWNNEGRSK